jgi:ribosomal protein L40E
MTYDRSAISLIETALDKNPVCRSCGAYTTIRAEGERVLVECGATSEPRGALARLLFALFPHERVVVIG